MPVHVECAKRTLTCWLYQLRIVMYFPSDTVTLIPLVFPFLLTETSQ